MKKKIIILGSTGSVGTNTLKIIDKDKKKFNVFVLSAHKNINKLLVQAKKFNCKNLIVTHQNSFQKLKKKAIKQNINIFNNFDILPNLLKKNKVFYSMISISGLDALKPSIILSKFSQNLAIVNKESLISAWHLINSSIKKNKVNFIPIDSEHYCIFNLLKNHRTRDIDKLYITASGGPFLNYSKKMYKKITPKIALMHPNWRMGKKISIDSSTMMNKVFEVIEAHNIFNIDYDKISILIHPSSYIHAIIKFKNGLIKIIAHEPDMKIPIHNSLYENKEFKFKTKSLDLKTLNNLNLNTVDINKFPVVKILKNLPKRNSLYETALITINDYLVEKFLKEEISFSELNNLIIKLSSLKIFTKFKALRPDKIDKIYNLRKFVSMKINSLGI